MSPYVITAHGTREGSLKAIEKQEVPASADSPEHVAKVKALLAEEIAALPDKVNGVRVTCDVNCHERARQTHITIVGAELHL